ncbi:MAG: ammonia-forming cytochrome c nitrite reductase subunit c552 [Coriobacteriia bacterium]
MKLKGVSVRKIIVLIVGSLAVGALVLGCAVSKDKGTAAANGDPTGKVGNTYWKTVYPNEYYSYIDGADDIDLGTTTPTRTRDGSAKAHGHALLGQQVVGLFEILNKDEDPSDRSDEIGCLSCKTSAFNDLYDKNGAAAYGMDSGTNAPKNADQYWDCYTCHADMKNPASSLGAQLIPWKTLGASLYKEVDSGVAVCGQCHNSTSYTYRYFLANNPDVDPADLDPYRYGRDADGVRKAIIEDSEKYSDRWTVDEATGIKTLWTDHPDVEMFQGSAMQQAGVTCVDCHMPKMTAADGTKYTSHNASGSPLDSEAALSYCLTCHKNQGIENESQMVDFVKAQQAEVGAHMISVSDKLDTLYAKILDGVNSKSVDAATLDKARQLYSEADWYYVYQAGVEEIPGEKVAHNKAIMVDYLDRADAALDAGIALFK